MTCKWVDHAIITCIAATITIAARNFDAYLQTTVVDDSRDRHDRHGRHGDEGEGNEGDTETDTDTDTTMLQCHHDKPRIVGVEGIIGAGKSTLLDAVKRVMGEQVLIVPERLDLWRALPNTHNHTNHNLLQDYYEDTRTLAIPFQLFVLLTRAEALKNALDRAQSSNGVVKLILTERSPGGDACFVHMLANSGVVPPAWYCMYRYAQGVLDDLVPRADAFIHLNASIATAQQQIRSRARSEEGGVSAEFQTTLMQTIHEWLAREQRRGVRVLTLNSNDVDGLGDTGRVTNADRTVTDTIRSFLGI
jgi:deoxyadenosine/deoxycytidine kinase